jgi:hypothetical protein
MYGIPPPAFARGLLPVDVETRIVIMAVGYPKSKIRILMISVFYKIF